MFLLFKHITLAGFILLICLWIEVFSLPITTGEHKRRYAVIVDAGSSGSRMFVYYWMTKTERDELPNLQLLLDKTGQPVVKRINPGISSFVNKLNELSEYLKNLLDLAASEIPPTSHEDTPLYILATAGMRLLTVAEQETIWSTVRTFIRSRYDFNFHDENAATITGAQEALYGWIAVNYILDRFSPEASEKKRKMTYGMLDQGGASVQIAFELEPDQPAPNDLVVRFALRATKWGIRPDYKIYLVSYLNFGANVMRSRFEELLLFNELQRSNAKAFNQPIIIQEPCLSKDKEQNATLVPRNATDVSPASPAELTYQVKFVGTGDYDTCRQTMYPILDKQTDCQPFQCAIGHTPQADIDFPVVVFYGLTNFYYSMEDFLPSSNYSYAIASKGVKEACAKTWEKFVEDFTKSHPELTQEQLQRAISLREYVCFKGVYTITLLHDGFNFPRDYQNLLVVDTLNNTDVQWSLGALFYILNFVPMDNPGGLLGYQIALILLAVILAIGISVIVTVMCVCKKCRADKALSIEPSTIEDTLANTQPDGISQPKPNL